MIFSLLAFGVAVVAGVLAVGASVVSSSEYEIVFVVSLCSGFLSVGCSVYLYKSRSRLIFAAITPSALGVYAITDALLRRFAGIRIFD